MNTFCVPCRVCSSHISFVAHPYGEEYEIELTGLAEGCCNSCGHDYCKNGTELDNLADAAAMIVVEA